MSMEVVNGYVCRNCTDVEYAKKGVDPAHPKDGPQGVYAKDKAEEVKAKDATTAFGPAVTLGGQLDAQVSRPDQVRRTPYVPGSTINLFA